VASVFVSLVFALRSAARSRAALHLEILALRHQVAVLNRSRLWLPETSFLLEPLLLQADDE
jgi:hypothetical protein